MNTQHNAIDRLHRLVTTMTNDDMSAHQSEDRARFIERCRIAFDAIEAIRALQTEVTRLQNMVAQMNGLANEGIDAPNAAYRWCERIDEVAHNGPMDEYGQYAQPPAASSNRKEAAE